MNVYSRRGPWGVELVFCEEARKDLEEVNMCELTEAQLNEIILRAARDG